MVPLDRADGDAGDSARPMLFSPRAAGLFLMHGGTISSRGPRRSVSAVRLEAARAFNDNIGFSYPDFG